MAERSGPVSDAPTITTFDNMRFEICACVLQRQYARPNIRPLSHLCRTILTMEEPDSN